MRFSEENSLPSRRAWGSKKWSRRRDALAESICGKTDRIDSPRVPGSRHCVEREVAAADSAKLFSLREIAHAFSLGERHPPVSRGVDRPENGRIVAIAQVGGLHHRYERRAA